MRLSSVFASTNFCDIWELYGCRAFPSVHASFLADKLEPHKLRRSVKLTEIAKVAKVSLERAVVDYLTMGMTVLLKEGRVVHPTSVEARNHLLNVLADVPDD